ncbi:MAG: hypothetical protein QNK05_15050 [Myxococcota bacterium]|nr:hypothetical protein [Myxococcota bacterium]
MVRDSLLFRATSHSLFRVALFTSAYMLLATWGALRGGNREFVFYIAVMTILIGCVAVVHARVRLTQGVLWLLSIWGALHMAGGLLTVPADWPIHGELRVVYNWWIIPGPAARSGEPGGFLKYDQAVHAFGFGVATWLCWQGLCGAMRRGEGDVEAPRPTAGLMVIVAAAGMGLGALNEVVEFVATRFTETNVGGYVNTGWDLVYNALGASVAAVIISLGSRSTRRPS